jgi:hypothetical protein
MNTILEIKKNGGSNIRKFQKIQQEAINHFKSLFQEPSGCNIAEILKVVSYFPRMIDEYKNENLEAEVPKEELKCVLQSFKKTKNPSPHEWTENFTWDFLFLRG